MTTLLALDAPLSLCFCRSPTTTEILGQVYPIARGSAPPLVAIGAFLFAGDALIPVALLGTLCLACGVMALAFERGGAVWVTPKPVIHALLIGVLIASYTAVDGLGARQAGSAIGFAVWLTIADELLTFLIVCMWKGRNVVRAAGA